jgi:pimeloyl-ACP methyl ester carboxylesterase
VSTRVAACCALAAAALACASPSLAAPPFFLGHLALSPCTVGARTAEGLATVSAHCAAFSVPEDWQRPQGRRIELRVALLAAEATHPDADVVTFLDGGPGGAASEDYPAVAPALEPLRARHHILLVDQRGTGGSNALSCAAPRTAGAPDPGVGNAASQGAGALEHWVHECLGALVGRAAPQFYTTSAAVRDLEAVRQALGSPPLDLIGVSYGTRLAQQYARRYPASVRSVVLDSPVPNTLALLADHARNLEQALRALFARCVADRPCAQRFGDPYALLHRVRARLQGQSRTVTVRDPVSFEASERTLSEEDLAALVRFYTYSPATAALLPLMLQQADLGNYATLLGQKQLLAQDLADQVTGALELSVLCAEDADLLRARPEDEDTLLGNGPIRRAQAACALWPRGERPADFHQPWRAATPTLLLSGELDPVTPPEYSRSIAQGLTRARVLLAPGQGHGVMSVGCMPRLIEQFLAALQPAALDDACLRRLGGTPAFLNYNGAAP